MFKSLQLKTDVTKQYQTECEENNLNNLSKINIFIGPNNSGKSRFLRDLFSIEEIRYNLIQLKLIELSEIYDEVSINIKNLKINYPYEVDNRLNVDNFYIKDEYDKEELVILFDEYNKIDLNKQYSSYHGINKDIYNP
ncbi:hypothetical protein [Empedobacter falsenii]|uniref:hypothetical protein n=1 Tax=Empedobacter falsenii TaxID=343874 RepID=UPI001C596F9E|nr:hypothetical protein [Empedobacter falsenii]MBW1619178.1 hypothetical protein [Empedobacter falsenii]